VDDGEDSRRDNSGEQSSHSCLSEFDGRSCWTDGRDISPSVSAAAELRVSQTELLNGQGWNCREG